MAVQKDQTSGLDVRLRQIRYLDDYSCLSSRKVILKQTFGDFNRTFSACQRPKKKPLSTKNLNFISTERLLTFGLNVRCVSTAKKKPLKANVLNFTLKL